MYTINQRKSGTCKYSNIQWSVWKFQKPNKNPLCD